MSAIYGSIKTNTALYKVTESRIMTKQKKDRESVKKHSSTKIRDNIKLLNKK